MECPACHIKKTFKGEKPFNCNKTDAFKGVIIRYYNCICGAKFKTQEAFDGLKNYLSEQLTMFLDEQIEKNKGRIHHTVDLCPRCVDSNNFNFRLYHQKKPTFVKNKMTSARFDLRERHCSECGTCWLTKETVLEVIKDSQISIAA